MKKLQSFDTTIFPTWCPGCLLPEELIHTQDGLWPIAKIGVGDKVLTHTGKFEQVSETYKHKYNGDIYQITANCFGTVSLTPEHPVLSVKRQDEKRNNKDFTSYWIRADQLKKGDYVVFPIHLETHDLNTIKINRVKSSKDTRSKILPKEVPLSNDILYLFGLYIAEGWIHSRAINFAFHLNERKLQQFVLKAFKKILSLNGSIKQFPQKFLAEIHFNHSVLARQFLNWFNSGANKKIVPEFLLNLPPQKQANLIRGLWEGDGYIYRNQPRASYKTISVTLAHQLKLLLLRQGIVPTISIYKAYKNHKISYSVQVVGFDDFEKLCLVLKKNTTLIKKPGGKHPVVRDKSHVYLPIRKIKITKYSGYVQNLKVEKNNSFISINSALHNCGDFGIWGALKQALESLKIKPDQAAFFFGVGCAGNISSFIRGYGFHSLHGRAIANAAGAKLANHKLPVIVIAGDGDMLGEGLSHFIHTARANHDITVILHNNGVLGLTTGQPSPTAEIGFKSKPVPLATFDEPINPCALAVMLQAGFVARGFAGDQAGLSDLIQKAMAHPGFSLVDVLQPCVTFNPDKSYIWYRQRIKPVKVPAGDVLSGIKNSLWTDKRIATGIIYQNPRPVFHSNYPQLANDSLLNTTGKKREIKKLLTTFS